MRFFTLSIVFILHFQFVSAQSVDSLFDSANESYEKGDFISAYNGYVSVLEKGFESEELFYNLGNSAYKSGKLGEGVFYFKKSLKLNPKNYDAKFNLNLLKSQTVDKFDVQEQPFIFKLQEDILNLISLNQWAIGAVLFSGISALFLFFYFLVKNSGFKRMFFLFSILMIPFIFLFVLGFYSKKNHNSSKEGVLVAKNSYIQNEPKEDGRDIFILHEGCEFILEEEVGQWYKLKLPDGKSGWVKNIDILVI